MIIFLKIGPYFDYFFKNKTILHEKSFFQIIDLGSAK